MIAKVWLLVVVVLCASVGGCRAAEVVTLGVGNFTEYVRAQRFVMVMFYAPWCKYCKQLKPSWDQISTITRPPASRQLDVVSFNCEEPKRNAEVCAELGVDRYPSLYFLGYGDFNQAPRGNALQALLGKHSDPA